MTVNIIVTINSILLPGNLGAFQGENKLKLNFNFVLVCVSLFQSIFSYTCLNLLSQGTDFVSQMFLNRFQGFSLGQYYISYANLFKDFFISSLPRKYPDLFKSISSGADPGVSGKLYRLWFELNKETEIKVKTGAGMSETTTVGETVAQGSIGGALISSLNLDGEVNHFFSGSINEAAYSDVRLQPLILQDDLCRIDTIMKLKQLELNVSKSCFIVRQKSSKAKDIQEELKNYPLTYDGI